MPRKKGLSVDEKRVRMREFFHETKSVYTLKQLEKLCHKHKGITQQTCKEILLGLVDDGWANGDKIGAGNFYWCFPSQELITRNNKISANSEEIKNLEDTLQSLEKKLEISKVNKEQTEERKEQLKILNELEEKNNSLRAELVENQAFDPELIEDMTLDIKTAKEAANRWTDNIFSIRSYVHNKFFMEYKDFDKAFELSEDFDYVE
eukprot:TRINITY_DN1406_c0_g1_i1.p1 TRINITY_DN1406_c0_g1~~TRINITY_DN1406_c0_g1_i1.p1  ORF type:complete len:206 (-),score=59.86 TRINITY_DN1406_c0_g1_i1:299-916(-)